MVTIKDIAEKIGVATSTVSYALNNDPRIPDETKHKIFTTAQEMGYHGKSGHKSAGGYLKQLVLCVNSISGEIYTELNKAIRNVLNVSNCELLLYVGTNISRIKWMDGLFMLNSQVPNDAITEITNRRIPVVLMDRDVLMNGAVNVTLDNSLGGYLVTKSVIAKGAKTFAFVKGPATSYESAARYNGFIKALSEAMLPRKNVIELQGDFTSDSGLNVSRYLLGLERLPDAIVCANDEMAFGITEGLKNAGHANDIWVAGFDGLKQSDDTRYITAKADRAHWGTTAAYAMLQMMQRVKVEPKITIPVDLVEHY